MANYRISQEVPWSEVLAVLRRRVQIRMRNCEIFLPGEGTGQWEADALKVAKQHLEKSLQVYQALRAFLGYTATTRIEKEAQELLEK